MKVALIYRRNEIYDRYIDTVRDTLADKLESRFGIEQAFPSSTNKQEIDNWFKENKERLLDYKFIIADYTSTSGILRYDGPNRYKGSFDEGDPRRGMKLLESLDSIFEGVSISLIKGDSLLSKAVYELDQVYNELKGKWIQKSDISKEDTRLCLIDILQKRVKKKPENVSILRDGLYEHPPFSSVNCKASELRDWFVEGGVSKVNLVSGMDDLFRYIGGYSEPTKNWMVYDRHVEIGWPLPLGCTVLQFPISSFVEDLASKGWIDFSEDDFRKKLRQEVEKIDYRKIIETDK
jgi:hypothetical protein